MVLKIADRVLEATTTTGTSNFSLAGAVDGYVTFAAAVGNGNRCYYAAVHSDLGSYDEWEVGIGTVGGGALTRQPISSSNSGAKVSFSVGTKHVFVTVPGVRAIFYDDDGKVFIGPSGDSTTFSNDEIFHVKGDIRASGVNLGSGLSLDVASAPADTTGKLYNLAGSLYWDGTAISTGQGSRLFNVIAGPSGTTETEYSNFPVMLGSGIIFRAGKGMDIIIDHPDHTPGQGSGILTFEATAGNTTINISAPSGTEGGSVQKQYPLTNGSGLIFEAERGITIELDNNTKLGGNGASGILTFRGPDLSTYIGAVASGIEIQNSTAIATTGNITRKGIVQLSNTIASESKLALTPKAVYDANYITQDDIKFNIGATNADGSGITVFRAPSGLFFKAGSNIGISLTDGGEHGLGLFGSGVLEISAGNSDTTYGAASGLVMDGDNIIRHENSAQSSVNNTNPFFIQDITLDSFGHITGINSASVLAPEVSTSLFVGSSGDQPDVNLGDGSGIMFIGGAGITIAVDDGRNDNAATNREGSGVITIQHNDTSSQASVNNAGNTFIQDVVLDEFGHVTSLTSAAVSATSTNLNTDGTPTAVASGGIPIFGDADSVHFDPKLTWSSGDIDLTQGVLGVEGYFNLAQVSAPSTTTDKLYNVGGNLTWNGTNLSAGIGAGALTSQGSDTPEISGIPFFSSSSTLGYDNRLVFASGSATSAKLGITSGSDKENNFPHSTLHADGSFATRLTSVTGINDEATAVDSVITLDNRHIAGSMNFYLPEAKVCQGRVYTLIRNSNHPSGIAVYGSGTDTIDGQTSETLWVDGDAVTLISCSGQYGYDYGWKSMSKNYSAHTVRLSLSPTGVDGITPVGTPGANTLRDDQGYTNYSWFVNTLMTFEGAQWAVPGLAASGNKVGNAAASFQGQSGVISNFTAMRDGLYNMNARFESRPGYRFDHNSVELSVIKYPYKGTQSETNPGNLSSDTAQTELVAIYERDETAAPDGEASFFHLEEGRGGTNGNNMSYKLHATDNFRLKEGDKLLFFLRPIKRNDGFLDHRERGSEFPDRRTFKLFSQYSHITITEIR